MKKNANKGFSLVELIIVIAIMAVLIGVLAPQFIKHVENSRQSTDMDNVQAIKTAIEAAAADEAITSAKITVTGGNGGTIAYDCKKESTTVTLDGAASSTKLKSSGWKSGATEYVYSFTDFNWGTAASCPNSKGNKGNDMASIFE